MFMMHNTASYKIALPTFLAESVFVATYIHKQAWHMWLTKGVWIKCMNKLAPKYRSSRRWPLDRPCQDREADEVWSPSWKSSNKTSLHTLTRIQTCRKGSVIPPTSCSAEYPVTRFFSISTREGTSCNWYMMNIDIFFTIITRDSHDGNEPKSLDRCEPSLKSGWFQWQGRHASAHSTAMMTTSNSSNNSLKVSVH